MSMHGSFLLLRGDKRTQLRQIFEAFNYRVASDKYPLDNWQESVKYRQQLPKDHVLKATWYSNGWTVIADDELVMCVDEKQCVRVANEFKTEIYGFLAEDASGSYGFWAYKPHKARAYFTTDGQVHEDTGEKIPAEEGINCEELFEDDLFTIINRLGAEIENWKGEMAVYDLDESHMVAQPERSMNPPGKPAVIDGGNPEEPQKSTGQTKRSWWKFW